MSYILEENMTNNTNDQQRTQFRNIERTSNQLDKTTHIMGKRTEQTFFNKEDIKMANMKGCLTSVVIREMQTKPHETSLQTHRYG